MARVFGRACENHVLEADLKALESNDSPEEHRAMGWNLRQDWRVNRAREAGFLALALESPSSATELAVKRRLQKYHRERVRGLRYEPDREPDFASYPLNQENTVSLHQDVLLVNILEVGGLWRSVSTALEHRTHLGSDNPLARLTSLEGYGEWVEFLDENVPKDRARWPHWILEAVAVANTLVPFNPVWSAPLADFSCALAGTLALPDAEAMRRTITESPPARWFEIVGKPRPAVSTWLMALCYPVGVAVEVFRPTTLDAGWFAEHHVTPRTAGGLGVPCGLAMDLGASDQSELPIAEYLHPQMIDQEFVRQAATFVVALKALDAADRRVHRLGMLRERHVHQLNSMLPQPVVWD